MENTLKEALASYPGGRRRFCMDTAISEGRLSQILKGERASPELAIRIHRVTHGAVSASALRPDLWREPNDVPIEAAHE
jgi:DNA-binding transcriptional regulator YdaS (Cro superfamily)